MNRDQMREVVIDVMNKAGHLPPGDPATHLVVIDDRSGYARLCSTMTDDVLERLGEPELEVQVWRARKCRPSDNWIVVWLAAGQWGVDVYRLQVHTAKPSMSAKEMN